MLRRSRTPALVLALLLLLVIPTAAADDGTTPPPNPYTEQAPPCVVPALRTKTLRQAKAAIVKAGCKLGVVRKRVAPKALVARVVAQSPARGKRLKRGALVGITLGRAAS